MYFHGNFMKRTSILSFGVVLFVYCLSFQIQAQSNLKKGNWSAMLQLNDSIQMPLYITVNSTNLVIHNAEEHIPLIEKKTLDSDSIEFHFPNFDSYLRVKKNSKTNLTGYWHNRLKGLHYKIPFSASYQKNSKTQSYEGNTVNGKWETRFDTHTENPYPAIGVFQQHGNLVTGTFLTETGDYRYLQGKLKENRLQLSAFDGSHAFFFVATLHEDRLRGTFYSGNHWQTTWEAILNNDATLRNADSITTSTEETQVSFQFPDLNGEMYTFPNQLIKENVVILQLMGSWCPNCLDESLFYKELQAKYGEQGLVVISLCYEIPKTLEQKIASVTRMKERNQLDFVFLIAGDAQKNLASQHFPMLNEIISFPTSLFFSKSGEIKRIHTGFSGPGTGDVFIEYKSKTIELIESLLAE